MISLGNTFWATNPNSNNPPHLFFVLTDPAENEGHVMLVNMTTRRPGADESCLLRMGDHPCVTKESVAFYAGAIFPATRMLEQAQYTGLFVPAADADLKLIRRLLEGALSSRHLDPKFLPIVQAQHQRLFPSP